MRWAIFVALSGCNWTFGVHDTRALDAQLFDVPADTPFACPPIGTAPKFSGFVHQLFVERCLEYSFNAGRAAGFCEDNGNLAIVEGPLDQILRPAPGLPYAIGTDAYDQPRLSSDGQFMLVRHFDYNTNASDVMWLQRIGDSWQLAAAPPISLATNDSIGTMARGPTGDRVLVTTRLDNNVHEWALEGTTWREVLVHPGSMLGVTIAEVDMTADGLRAMIQPLDGSSSMYTDRIDETSLFRPASVLDEGLTHVLPTMTEDCARIYVTGLGAVFYAQQL